MGQIRARVRVAKPDGSPDRVLPTLSVNASLQAYQAASLSVTTTEDLPDECVLILEVSVGDGWYQPRNGLFLMQESSSDGRDLTGTRTFTGVPWFSALARRAVVFPVPAGGGNKPAGERIFGNPGSAVRTILSEAQDRGWGQMVEADFDATHDSTGNAWTRTDSQARVWATLTDFLDTVVSEGSARWWTEGTTLKMSRSLEGEDKTGSVKLRSGSSRPVKTNATDITTDLVVVYGDSQYVVVPNPGADGTFGRRWTVLTLDVSTEAKAIDAAQAYLADLRAPLRQVGFRYEGVIDFLPFRDFEVGDVVLARLVNGWEARVVQGVTITSGESTSVEVAVGDRIVSGEVKRAKKIGQLALGSISGGSAAFPALPAPAPPSTVPVEPQNLRVVSNEGQWVDGDPVGAVVLAWDQVTTSVDGEPLQVAGYEVWGRTESRPPHLIAASTVESADVRWAYGDARWVKVRAQSRDGVWSAFSEEMLVTPVPPVVSTGVPSAPGLDSPSAVVLVSWDGLLADGSVPAGFQYVQAEFRTSADWVVGGTPGYQSGQVASVQFPAGTVVDVRLRWVDRVGRVSEPSAVSTVTVGSIRDQIGPGDIGPDDLDVETIWSSQVWTDVLRSGVIGVDMITPNFGEDVNLVANGSIQLVTGRVADAEMQLAEFSQAVLFEADGTSWTSPGSPISLKLSNTGIAIRRDGVVMTEWVETEMRVPKLRALQTFVGDTVISERPGGASWVHI